MNISLKVGMGSVCSFWQTIKVSVCIMEQLVLAIIKPNLPSANPNCRTVHVLGMEYPWESFCSQLELVCNGLILMLLPLNLQWELGTNLDQRE